MPVPAADLTFDLFACWAALALVAVVLIAGWLTRTAAVIAVSLGLGLSATVLLGAWLAYRLSEPADDGDLLQEITLLRLIGGVALSLFVLAVWALVRLFRRDAAVRRSVQVPRRTTEPAGPRYDREWLLSLLQERAAARREKVANGGAGQPTPPVPAGATENGKPER